MAMTYHSVTPMPNNGNWKVIGAPLTEKQAAALEKELDKVNTFSHVSYEKQADGFYRLLVSNEYYASNAPAIQAEIIKAVGPAVQQNSLTALADFAAKKNDKQVSGAALVEFDSLEKLAGKTSLTTQEEKDTVIHSLKKLQETLVTVDDKYLPKPKHELFEHYMNEMERIKNSDLPVSMGELGIKSEIKYYVTEVLGVPERNLSDEFRTVSDAKAPEGKGPASPAPEPTQEEKKHIDAVKLVLDKVKDGTVADLKPEELKQAAESVKYLEEHKKDSKAIQAFTDSMESELKDMQDKIAKQQQPQGKTQELTEVQKLVKEIVSLISPQLAENLFKDKGQQTDTPTKENPEPVKTAEGESKGGNAPPGKPAATVQNPVPTEPAKPEVSAENTPKAVETAPEKGLKSERVYQAEMLDFHDKRSTQTKEAITQLDTQISGLTTAVIAFEGAKKALEGTKEVESQEKDIANVLEQKKTELENLKKDLEAKKAQLAESESYLDKNDPVRVAKAEKEATDKALANQKEETAKAIKQGEEKVAKVEGDLKETTAKLEKTQQEKSTAEVELAIRNGREFINGYSGEKETTGMKTESEIASRKLGEDTREKVKEIPDVLRSYSGVIGSFSVGKEGVELAAGLLEKAVLSPKELADRKIEDLLEQRKEASLAVAESERSGKPLDKEMVSKLSELNGELFRVDGGKEAAGKQDIASREQVNTEHLVKYANKELDVDKDGKVTKADLEKAGMERVGQLADINRDGRTTNDELKATFAQLNNNDMKDLLASFSSYKSGKEPIAGDNFKSAPTTAVAQSESKGMGGIS